MIAPGNRLKDRRAGGRIGSHVGMGSVPSGDHIITPFCRFKTEYLMIS